MKNLIRTTLIVICACLIVLHLSHDAEAKKIKKILKAAKKMKKYAWVLAARNKKFYAIPFPMPLPVFVKRQQIYTQVPIIPRYVQHPQPYGSPSMAHYSSDSQADSMGASGTTPSEMRYQMNEDQYYQSSSQSAVPMKRKRKKHHQAMNDYDNGMQQFATTALPSSTKYLQQIAAALTSNYNSGGSSLAGQMGTSVGGLAATSGRDVLAKLLTGQAKIITPTSLLSSIKSSTASTVGPSMGSGEQTAHNDPYDQPQSDQSHSDKTSSQSNSYNSDSAAEGHSSSHQQSAASPAQAVSSSAKDNSNSDATSSDTKTAASEFYRTLPKPLRQRLNLLAEMQQHQQLSLMPLNRLIAMGLAPPMRHPVAPQMAPSYSAAMAATQMGRIPLLQLAQQQQQQQQKRAHLLNHLAEDSMQQDQQDMAASQDQEQMASLDGQLVPVTRQQLLQRQLALARHLQLQQQLHNQNQQLAGRLGPLEMDQQQAMLLKQRQQQQQQQLYSLALAARERRQAQQLAESRAIVMRAHQLGLLTPNDQARYLQSIRQN